MGIYRHYEKRKKGVGKLLLECYIDEEGIEYRIKTGSRKGAVRRKKCSALEAKKELGSLLKKRSFVKDDEVFFKEIPHSPFAPDAPRAPKQPSKPRPPKKYFERWVDVKWFRDHSSKPILLSRLEEHIVEGTTSKDYGVVQVGWGDQFVLRKKVKELCKDYEIKLERYNKRKAKYNVEISKIQDKIDDYEKNLEIFKFKQKEARKMRDLIKFELEKKDFVKKYGEKEFKKIIRGE